MQTTESNQIALPFRSYRGDDPYVFVSYAHSDADVIYPHLTWLHDSGVKVWYDEGIQVGSIWRDELALAVESSCRVLYFLTTASANSHYCRTEISYAAELGLPISTVVLEDVALPGVLRLADNASVYDGMEKDWRESLLARIKNDNATTSEHQVSGPSIAVLPFIPLGGKEETAQLANALTDDITTALCSTPEFFVIAQTSSAAFSSETPNIREIGNQLGVRYAVLGTIRQSGSRLRASVELIQTDNAEQLWKERFDFSIDDLFATSDDVIEAICAQIQTPLQATESRRAERLAPDDLDAWLLTQRAKQIYFVSGNDREHIFEAEQLLELALEKDPGYPHALAFSANVKTMSILFGYSQDPLKDRELALQRGRSALAVAPADPSVLGNWGNVLAFLENPTSAVPIYEEAIARDPNNPHHRANFGFNLYRIGRREDAIKHVRQAFRLSPKDPRLYMWHFYTGGLDSQNPKRAIEEFNRSISLFDRYLPAWSGKVIALGRLELWDQARTTIEELLRHMPEVTQEGLWNIMQAGLEGDTKSNSQYQTILKEAFSR